MSPYFDIFIGASQQMISHSSTQPHALSTVRIKPHVSQEYLFPFTLDVFFAAGVAAVLIAPFAAGFFAAGAFFAAVFGAVFFGADVFAGAGAFFVAMLPPLQVV